MKNFSISKGFIFLKENRLNKSMSELLNNNKPKDWRLIEYFVPITEFSETPFKEGFEPDFIIRGVAINETTTHNGHKYIAEELQKASSHLIGKKLLVDHDNRVESIKGVIKNSWWNDAAKRIEFEGSVKDKTIKEMIRDGRLSDVSIGAYARDLVEEDGAKVAKGLQIVELSFVAVPADSKANFAMAMDNSYQIKESIITNKVANERRLDEMEDSKELNENVELKATNLKILEELNSLKTEKKQLKVNEYKRLCAEKAVKEKDVSKASEETIDMLIEQIKEIKNLPVENTEKKQLKSVVSEKVVEEVTPYVVEKSALVKGIGFWAMPDAKKRHVIIK